MICLGCHGNKAYVFRAKLLTNTRVVVLLPCSGEARTLLCAARAEQQTQGAFQMRSFTPAERRRIAVEASTTPVTVDKFLKTNGDGMRSLVVERIKAAIARLFPTDKAVAA